VAVDQRNFTATVSIADIATKVENDHRESVMKLTQAHNVSVKRFTPLFTRICRFQEVGQLSDQTALRGDNCSNPECARQSGDDRHSFLTIWDNVLNVGGSAGGKKQASRHQPQSGGLPVGVGGGTKNGTTANFAKSIRQ
jgi:hypothetical protein